MTKQNKVVDFLLGNTTVLKNEKGIHIVPVSYFHTLSYWNETNRYDIFQANLERHRYTNKEVYPEHLFGNSYILHHKNRLDDLRQHESPIFKIWDTLIHTEGYNTNTDEKDDFSAVKIINSWFLDKFRNIITHHNYLYGITDLSNSISDYDTWTFHKNKELNLLYLNYYFNEHIYQPNKKDEI